MHGPHAPPWPSPVCVSVHVFNEELEHNEDGRLPESAVLLESVSICRVDGNAEGMGGCKLLLSRCSSVSAENEEMDDGIEVDNPVDERSLLATCKYLTLISIFLITYIVTSDFWRLELENRVVKVVDKL